MRILYVEDDPRDADLTARKLRRFAPNWRVETVGSFKSAVRRLERLGEDPLDLALMDMRLPDGSGLDLLAHIRDLALPIAVVIITGFGDEEAAVAALKAGANDYIVKRKDYIERLPLMLESALYQHRADALRRSRPLKVIYAEHNSADTDLTLRHLATHAPHIHLDVVSTGPEALNRIKIQGEADQYDVILLDYRLPGLDALEILKELRLAENLDLPVVLVTGRGDEEIANQAMKLGASSYIVKSPGYLYKLPAELENASLQAELLRREKALRQSEERYKLATLAGAVGVWDWDLRTGEMYIDPVLKSFLGYQDDEICNHIDDWGRHVHPLDVDAVKQKADAYIAGEIPQYEVEHRMLCKDGSTRWFLGRGSVVRDERGIAVRLVGTDTDITERKIAAQTLHESEARNRAILDAMPDFIFLNSREGVFLGYHTKDPGELYMSPEHFLGKRIRDVFPQELAELFDRGLEQSFESNEPVVIEYALPRGGEEGYYEARMVRCDDDKVLSLVRDLTAHKRAEQALRESEEHYRNLFEQSVDGIFVATRDGRYVDVSPAGAGMLGMTREEVLGSTFLDVLAPEDHHRIAETVNSLLKGEPHYGEWHFRRKDGSEFIGELTGFERPDGLLQGIVRDISERKRAEELLRQSQENYANLVDSIDGIVWVADPRTFRFSFVSKQAERLLGYPVEQWLGEKSFWRDHIHPDDEQWAVGFCMSAIAELRDHEFQYRMIAADGRAVWLHDFVTVTVENNGVVKLQGVMVDISEHKSAEQELQTSQARVAGILDIADEAIISVDANQRMIIFNQGAEKIFGYAAEEIIGQPVDVLIPSNFALRHSQHITEFGRSGDVSRRMGERREIFGLRKDGSEFPAEASISKLNLAGELTFTISLRDITDRRQAEAALQETLAELKELKDRLQEENVYLQEAIQVAHNFGEIIGRSDALKRTLRQAEQVAPLDTTVLITGETGTGKELLAHAIHRLSPRKIRPMVNVNCATLPAHLIESELFGHEKGAFTGAIARRPGRFEIANGGTIFLDEVGELPLELQVKLLRVLQEGEFERLGSSHTMKVDVRVIAATNRDLEDSVRKGLFRSDLFYRLSIFPITLPPLRGRREDVPLLVTHFVKQLATKFGKKIESVSQEMLDELQNYSWPGNIRELRNIIERAVITTRGTRLRLIDGLEHGVDLAITTATIESAEPIAAETLEESQRSLIIQALEKTYWRIEGQNGAAQVLGIHPNTLRSRMKRLNISKPQFKAAPERRTEQ